MATDGGVNALLSLVVAKSGSFTGRLAIGNTGATVRGKFDAQGTSTVKVTIPGQAPWTLTLQRDAGGESLSATASSTEGSIPIGLSLNQYSKSSPAPESGKYTALIEVPADAVPANPQDTPSGAGWATFVISNLGAVRATGRLADNTPVIITSTLDPTGHFVISNPLYAGLKGSLSGEIALQDTPGVSDGNGTLVWNKPAQKAPGFYSKGINTTVSIRLSRFQDLKRNVAAPAISAITTLSEGELPDATPIQHNISLRGGTILTVLDPTKDSLRLSLAPTTGTLSGTFVHPADRRTRTIRGVLYQKTGSAGGFFPGQKTTGNFEITGLPAR
jgi:hypothetical protein